MKDIKKDFESFANDTATESGSSFVLSKIHSQLKKELPSPWRVASKLGLAHLAGSFVTLMSCSQFGVQLFFDGGGLMHLFMKISPSFCYAFCGALYFSISFLIARMTLRPDEWLMIARSKVLSISSLALVSLGGLSLVSHEVNFETGLLWLFGAAVGGELVTLIKSPSLWRARIRSK
ncbi:hypothetical protein QJS83_15160 [Bdellovibrio sp. 22V]|uniref:hypothetical protein n=1 Tax=Bdellovibrio sp. 22V TaxID=3044166 RepID=UPI002542CC57|nr:hypothetical protein [Bdellovibrio sp. 22V]WII71802.1 hypothetical protein QJS83_15160 [Bdellovibrio sp. 22V]